MTPTPFLQIKAQPMTRLPWKRFWIGRGESWVSDDGFLFDPESDHASYVGNVPLDAMQIRSLPVIAFLGEAGIGKSNVLHEEAEIVRERISGTEAYLFRDLNEFGSEDRLIREIFESEEFRTYQHGSGMLHLFLDSFDECRLGIPHLSRILAAEFRRRVTDPLKLYLRVACRSADWPSALEQALRDVWGDENGSKVGVFELCPLRKQDAALYAKTAGADGEAFLEAVLRREAGTLASRPKTLGFLLGEFMRHGDLPQRKVDLYERGCLHLCEESPERIAAGRGGKLTAKRRLRVAGRIAAALIFSNRTGVWLGSSLQQLDSDLSLDQLAGNDRDAAGEFPVDREVLRETLLVGGLFRQRGAERVHFEHQTDAEFLSAWYVVRSGMEIEQLMALIRHPEDCRVVPQLYQTAAWMASLDVGVFSVLTETEPEILLASDIATTDLELRRSLATRLIEVHHDAKYYDRLDTNKLHKLTYPGMSNQLADYILNRKLPEQARRLAIDIAHACRVAELQDDLLKIALDQNEPYLVRAAAAEAVGELDDGAEKRRLLPLASEDKAHDPDDRLKGAVLSSLWPQQLTSAELFGALREPNNRNLIGSYSVFVRHDLPRSLQPIHLVDALCWVEKKPPSHELDLIFQDLIPTIMRMAWEHITMPGVLPAFARVALRHLREHEPLFTRRGGDNSGDELADAGKRRLLIQEMLTSVGKNDSHYLAWQVVRPEDAAWLMQRFNETVDLQEREVLAEVIGGTVRVGCPTEVVNDLLDACGVDAPGADPILRKSLRWLVEPWLLDSDWVIETRKNWHLLQTRKEERKRKPLTPSANERVSKALNLTEGGAIDAWIILAREMTLEDTSTHYGFPHKLHEQPGWLAADTTTRKRILQAGIRFLQTSSPDNESIFGTNEHTDRQFAGGIALELLNAVAPSVLDDLDPGLFAKWASLIVIYHFSPNESAERLFRLTSQKAPEAFRAAILRRTADHAARQPDALFLHDIENVWSEGLAHDLFGLLKGQPLAKSAHDAILGSLMRHGFRGALDFAKWRYGNGALEDRSTAAVLLLMWDTESREDWLAKILASDSEFRHTVLLELASHLQYGGDFSSMLSENALADLYMALEREFPHKDDPQHEGAYTVTTRDFIVRFRDGLLHRLAGQGTVAARNAMERIVAQYPEHVWLSYWLERARTETRRGTWTPVLVPELFAISEDRHARLVRSEAELLDAVVLALGQLQKVLQGETPLAPLLWNEGTGGTKAIPKSENRFSDFVKHHLRQYLNRRGIVINREVEVHNWPGKGRGHTADLMVQAMLPDGVMLTVVVEVKGCWHDELYTAMDAQLRQEYLIKANHRCGLYLVGWFGNEHCRSNKQELDELARILAEQAAALSQNGLLLKEYVLNAQFGMPSKH